MQMLMHYPIMNAAMCKSPSIPSGLRVYPATVSRMPHAAVAQLLKVGDLWLMIPTLPLPLINSTCNSEPQPASFTPPHSLPSPPSLHYTPVVVLREPEDEVEIVAKSAEAAAGS